jgi:hypothetical protein
MRHALEQAMGGHGHIVAVIAEAGTGKSRLVYEFKHLVPQGCKILEAYSVSHGKRVGRWRGPNDADVSIVLPDQRGFNQLLKCGMKTSRKAIFLVAVSSDKRFKISGSP